MSTLTTRDQQSRVVSFRWRLAAIAAMVSALMVTVTPANAHIPVLLDHSDTVVAIGHSPLVPSGTVSFAFYGRTGGFGDTRAVRIQLVKGQQFHAELLIPDLEPETALQSWQLPRLAVRTPGGQVRVLADDQRAFFFEPFTGTAYLTLAQTTTAAETGTYQLVVIGIAPSRFVAVTGQVEQFTAALKNATVASLADVHHWYSTPPTANPADNAVAGSSLLRTTR